MAIEPGQIYRSLSSRHPVDGPTRIKVVGWNRYGFGKADVVTVTRDGREIRRRAIEAAQLRESATTKAGQPRRTGYVLEPAN